MDKLERLLNLTAALLDTDRVLSAEELRRRIGGYPQAGASFRRTFERDKEDLRKMGIPLRVEAVAGSDPPIDGYRILRSEYAGRELRLEPDELAALHLATSIVRLDGGETGLRKLGGASGSVEAAEVGHVPFDDNLANLIAAAAERRAVGFSYRGGAREVEPWRLSFSRGHWYLAGWDRLRDEQRLYRADRIAGAVELLDDAVRPRGTPTDPNKLRGWELGDETPVTVRVAVDPDQAAYLQHLVGEDSEPADGVGSRHLRGPQSCDVQVVHPHLPRPRRGVGTPRLPRRRRRLARGTDMNARLTASERMTRLLAVIPWVVQQQGAPLDEIAARFDYPRSQLVEDLTGVVFFVGVHPFTPDSMIEVDVSDDEVQISYADWFSRPLRLTPSEGARLLTAGHSLLSDQFIAGGDNEEAPALLRALTKLSMALGEAADQAVEVRLGDAGRETLAPLRSAVDRQEQVEIEYYAYGRDELTRRIVEPSRVFSDNGNWYLDAWCHRAEAQRVFRVDRIRSVRLIGTGVEYQPSGPAGVFTPDQNDPRVVLRLHPDSAWVVEQYPTESVETDETGHLTVSMAVSAVGWLERLMLRLGPSAEIVAIDAPLSTDLVSEAANRVLQRYR